MNQDLKEFICFRRKDAKHLTLSIIVVSYLLLELIMYLGYFFIDNGFPNNIIEYMGIITNFLFVFLFFIISKERRSFKTLFLLLALLFTCCADYCLVVLGDKLLTGMIFFFFVQLCYLIWQQSFQKKKLPNKILILLTVILIILLEIIAALILKDGYNLIIVFGCGYAVLIITNIVMAFVNIKNDYLLPIGFVLFFLCDINVGLKVILDANNPYVIFLLNCPLDIITFFYMPSQVLISLIITKNKL